HASGFEYQEQDDQRSEQDGLELEHRDEPGSRGRGDVRDLSGQVGNQTGYKYHEDSAEDSPADRRDSAEQDHREELDRQEQVPVGRRDAADDQYQQRTRDARVER